MEPFCYDKYSYSLGTLLRNRLLRWQSSRALRAADRVIAVSAFAREQLEVGLCIPTERTRRIYNGRNTEFSPCGEAEEDRSLLRAIGVEGEFMLTCGSLLPYRRCEDVIAAFNLSARSLNADVKLVIAGSGNDPRYAETVRRAISQSPYSDRIVAAGHVPKEAMITLYRRSLLCVIATEIEACPTIAIEAMTSGCVILSSDRPPLPEMFGDSSVEYQARDIAALAAKLALCLNDDALRSEMKKRALQRSRSFSWEKCAKETYAALVEWPEG